MFDLLGEGGREGVCEQYCGVEGGDVQFGSEEGDMEQYLLLLGWYGLGILVLLILSIL